MLQQDFYSCKLGEQGHACTIAPAKIILLPSSAIICSKKLLSGIKRVKIHHVS